MHNDKILHQKSLKERGIVGFELSEAGVLYLDIIVVWSIDVAGIFELLRGGFF